MDDGWIVDRCGSHQQQIKESLWKTSVRTVWLWPPHLHPPTFPAPLCSSRHRCALSWFLPCSLRPPPHPPPLLLPWSPSLLLFSSPLLPDSNQSDSLSYGAASRCKNNRNNFSRPHGSGDRLWRHWRMQNGKIRIWLCCGVCCLSGETHVFVCQIWIMCLIICRLPLWCCSRRSAASPLRYEARSCFRRMLVQLALGFNSFWFDTAV